MPCGARPGSTRQRSRRWHPVAAAPTTHLATLDELRTLCEEAGREEWADEAASLARTGFRLTRGGDGSSWLGGTPRAGSFEWPVWDGVELAFLGRIALAGLPHSALPAGGALLLFFAVDRAPSGNRRADSGACRVVHVEEDPTEDEPLYGGMPFAAVTPSAELTLPAAPALPALDADELEEWTELRERLAAAQGVELEERAASYHALHRLLGHPDTYAEGMEVDAELVSRGVDLDDEPFADVSDEEQSSAADDLDAAAPGLERRRSRARSRRRKPALRLDPPRRSGGRPLRPRARVRALDGRSVIGVTSGGVPDQAGRTGRVRLVPECTGRARTGRSGAVSGAPSGSRQLPINHLALTRRGSVRRAPRRAPSSGRRAATRGGGRCGGSVARCRARRRGSACTSPRRRGASRARSRAARSTG